MTPVNELLEVAALTSSKGDDLDADPVSQGDGARDCADALADSALSAHFQPAEEPLDARATPSGTVAYALIPLQIAGDEPLTPAANPSQAQKPALLPLARRRDPERWIARLREGVAAARASDRVAGVPRYGWRRTPTGRLARHDLEQRNLARMVSLRRTGGRRGLGATLQEIADVLNALGWFNRDGAGWRRSTVQVRLFGEDVYVRGVPPLRPTSLAPSPIGQRTNVAV